MTGSEAGPTDSLIARLVAGEEVDLPASGGSMFPLVRNGDVVRVQPVRDSLRIGDVVLAVIGGRWVLHRIVAVGPFGYTLRGDNRRAADPPVGRAAVVGVAAWSRRGGRRMPLAWPRPLARAWILATRAVVALTPAAERVRRTTRPRHP